MRSEGYLISLAALATSLMPAGQASAQTAPEEVATATAQPAEQSDPFEIIVTAQRRSERLSDVPMSITAIKGDQLARQGITDVAQLQKLVPGFSFQQSTLGVPIYSIRGIGFYDTSVTANPTVTTYVDEVPLAYSAEARGVALDVERVEALKGPQGTLYGLNSTGGAINFIAAKPTESLTAGFDIDAGRFNTVNAQAFVSAPLSPNLGIRVAVRNEYRGDWQKSYSPNDALFGKTGKDSLGERKFLNGRLLLDWAASDSVNFRLNVNGWRDRSDTQAARFDGFYATAPADPFNAGVFAALGNPALTQLPKESRIASWDAGRDYARDDYFYQASLAADIGLGDALSLHSISAYSRYRERSLTDPDGLTYTNLTGLVNADIELYYQELRVSGSFGPVSFMAGGNYAHDSTNESQLQHLSSTNAHLGPFPFTGVYPRNAQKIDTWAGFGSADIALTDTLTLRTSARYTDQRRDFDGCLADPGNGSFSTAISAIFGVAALPGHCLTQAAPGVLLPSVTDRLSENNFSWRGSLNWKPGTDSLLYLSVSRGYKAGGFSLLPAIFAVELTPARQELVLSYEAGFRASAMQRRIQLSGAVFYYDYKDKQITGSIVLPPFGALPTLLNIPKSRVYGAELEFTARPVEGLRLAGGVTYVNSRIQENPSNPLDMYGFPADFIGESFPSSPKWQGVVDAEYGFEVGNDLRLFAGASVTARSSTATVLGNSNSILTGRPKMEVGDYILLDLRAGIEGPDGRWRAQIWGHNVTDTFYLTQKIKQVDTLSEFVGMPATYGITLSFRYR